MQAPKIILPPGTWTFRGQKALDLCGFPGAVKRGVVYWAENGSQSVTGAFPALFPLSIMQRIQKPVAQLLGRLNRHRNVTIPKPQRWGRTVPPLPNGLRVKASVPAAVGLTALWVLLPPLKNTNLGFGPSIPVPPSTVRIIKGLHRSCST